MQIAMHTHGLPGKHHDSLFSLADRRTNAAFGRLTSKVALVVMHLTLDNSPRGGAGRRCVAEVRLADGRRLVTRDQSADWSDAIGRTVRRAAGMLKRLSGRTRTLMRH